MLADVYVKGFVETTKFDVCYIDKYQIFNEIWIAVSPQNGLLVSDAQNI